MKETSSRKRFILPALLLSLYVAQCLWFVDTQSICCDEPAHMAAGLAAWRNNNFEVLNDHPPLERLLGTVLLAPGNTSVDLDYQHHNWVFPDPVRAAWLRRLPVIFLGVALGMLLWFACRSWFSEAAANFALALFAVSPEMIGHFSVVSTDGAGIFGVFLASLTFARWRSRPTPPRAIVLGVGLGVALLCKHYTLPLVLAALLLVWLPFRSSANEHASPRWRHAVAVWALALVVFWAGYFFHTGFLAFENGESHLSSADPSMQWPVPFRANLMLPVPAPEYFASLVYVHRHNSAGHPSYLMGRYSQHGWTLYYPIAIFLKWPIIVLLLALFGGVVLLRRGPPPPASFFLLPLLFLITAVGLGHIQIGVRHIAPLYPFLLVLAAAAWSIASSTNAKVVLVILVLLQAVDTFRYSPNVLSYFNVYIPEKQVYRFISDSSSDWGQSLIALKHYQNGHPGEVLHVAPLGGDPAMYDIKTVPLSETERVSGTVIVSATHLSGQLNQDHNAYRWLLQYPVDRVINHSLYLFKVPAERGN